MKQNSNHSIQLDAARVRELFHSGTRKEFIAGVRLALRQILAKLHVEEALDNPNLLKYLNRLSSLCFILSLWETKRAGFLDPTLAKDIPE